MKTTPEKRSGCDNSSSVMSSPPAELTSGQSSKSNRETLPDTPNAIFSLESEDGPMRSDSHHGQTTAQSGLARVHARHLRKEVKERGLRTLAISGLIGSDSSPSRDLQLSLESNLARRLSSAGS